MVIYLMQYEPHLARTTPAHRSLTPLSHLTPLLPIACPPWRASALFSTLKLKQPFLFQSFPHSFYCNGGSIGTSNQNPEQELKISRRPSHFSSTAYKMLLPQLLCFDNDPFSWGVYTPHFYFFRLFVRSFIKECFGTPLRPTRSTVFFKTAGCMAISNQIPKQELVEDSDRVPEEARGRRDRRQAAATRGGRCRGGGTEPPACQIVERLLSTVV
jgi:hypothetical protein